MWVPLLRDKGLVYTGLEGGLAALTTVTGAVDTAAAFEDSCGGGGQMLRWRDLSNISYAFFDCKVSSAPKLLFLLMRKPPSASG